MSKKAFNKIMSGIEDTLAYARGDKSRGLEHVVEVSETTGPHAVRRLRKAKGKAARQAKPRTKPKFHG